MGSSSDEEPSSDREEDVVEIAEKASEQTESNIPDYNSANIAVRGRSGVNVWRESEEKESEVIVVTPPPAAGKIEKEEIDAIMQSVGKNGPTIEQKTSFALLERKEWQTS
eukprot:TRINITY_DN1811_c0_g1_i1.p1 TRINITY_DN1811_c0_g1~~TRINITY_DN1811_c0_g1_i1.p1  ORF type:complete len:122 (-),score=29.15 TRINITY_DN1811_c0_g1_i1:578-907(-)